MKLLITILITSKQIYSDETFKKLYQAFMPNYKELYEPKGFQEKKDNEIVEENNDSAEEKEENEEEEKKEEEQKEEEGKVTDSNLL